MISPLSHTREWINQHCTGLDPILAEKMILAFTLVEKLRASGLEFIFKGGTSLPLVSGAVNRFSIDVDMIVDPGIELIPYLDKVVDQGVFTGYDEVIRKNNIPARHFRIYFKNLAGKDDFVLLDALFERNPYPLIQDTDINSTILKIEGDISSVKCPTIECLLGDKLTAYAPNTTGIQYQKRKELEIVKQLFDISTLFDIVIRKKDALPKVFESHTSIAIRELQYRELTTLTPENVLWDSFNTSCMIGTYGQLGSTEHFKEVLLGSSQVKGYTLAGAFRIESSILCAAKAACLVAAGISRSSVIKEFNPENTEELLTKLIKNPKFNKLNKTRGLGAETYFYYCQALEFLGLFE